MKISELLESKGRFVKGPGGVPILTQAQKNRAEERARVKAQKDMATDFIKKNTKVFGDHPEKSIMQKARENPEDDSPAVRAAWKAYDAAEKAKAKAPKMAASEIVYRVQDLIANSFPDGDPIDYVHPWIKKSGLTMDDVDAAFAKEYKKKGYDMYKYMADLWDDFAADALADANTMLNRGEDVQNSAFVKVNDSKAVKKSNPWK